MTFMKSRSHTVGPASKLLERVDGTQTASYFARQLRAFIQTLLIAVSTRWGDHATAAAVFDDAQLFKARLYSLLVRMGFTLAQLKDVDLFINEMALADLERLNGLEGRARNVKLPGLSYALKGVLLGEDWYLKLQMSPHGVDLTDGEGERMVVSEGGFSTKPDGPLNPKKAQHFPIAIVLHVNPLVRGLFPDDLLSQDH